MDQSIMTSLMEEMIGAIRGLYLAAPPGAFKNGQEFHAALRAADKTKAYLDGDLDVLVEMEREDTRYWRERFIAAMRNKTTDVKDEADISQVCISVQPAEVRNVILGTPQRRSPNPEDEDDLSSIGHIGAGSAVSSVIMEEAPRPRISLAATLMATPNMGPILPSPVRVPDLIYDAL